MERGLEWLLASDDIRMADTVDDDVNRRWICFQRIEGFDDRLSRGCQRGGGATFGVARLIRAVGDEEFVRDFGLTVA